jgi:hypothetical protein
VVASTLLLLCASPAAAQPGGDTLRVVTDVAARVRSIGAIASDSIWPGFRPDTIPLLFVFPGRGSALFGWSGAPPAGFAPLPGGGAWAQEGAQGAASTSTTLGGRHAAQVVVRALDVADLAGTAVHEAFHVFERASVAPGRRFGGGENSALTSRYPVFDVAAEAHFALEGRLLDDALRARDPAERRALARQFIAVREARHRRLPDEFAQFDRMAEINEGLAEYALVRTLALLARDRDTAVAGAARSRLARQQQRLRTLTLDTAQSVRLRFYATGPAMARLLDALQGPAWKRRLVDENLALQEALALATGYRQGETALRQEALRRYGARALEAEARDAVERLRASRRARLERVLARPGLQLVVDASRMAQHDVGLCGFDPQNILRVSPTVEMHMRWVRPCNTSTTFGEFNTPVVHDEGAGTLTAVLGSEADVQVTAGGAPLRLADGERREAVQDVKISSPAATYQAERATLERRGRVLRVTLLPPQ